MSSDSTFRAQETIDGLVLVEGSPGQFTAHGGFASFRSQIQAPAFSQLPGSVVTPLGPTYTLPSVSSPVLKSLPRSGLAGKIYEFMFVIKNEDSFTPMLNVIGGAGWNITPFTIPLNQSAFVLVQQTQQQCTAYTYMSGSTGFLVPGVSGVETGGSGLTLPSGFTIALANSGVVAGTYGDASNIPRFTVDARGRITTATTQAVVIPDQLASVATRSWGAGTGRPAVGTKTESVYIGDSVNAGDQSVSIGYLANTRGSSVSVGKGAITRDGSVSVGESAEVFDFSTAIGYRAGKIGHSGGSCVFLGRESTCANIADTSVVSIGGFSSAGTNAVACGQIAFSADQSVSVGFNAAAPQINSVALGFSSSARGAQNVTVGASAGAAASGTNNTSIGYLSGTTLSGANNTCVGASSKISAAVNQSCSIGVLAETQQSNSNTFGYQVVNNEANTTRIGSNGSTSHVVRSEGFFKSANAVSGAAGINPGTDAPQPIAVFPTTIDLKSTRFEIFQVLTNIDLPNDLFYLGNYPYDLGSTFMVSASILGVASAASFNFTLELMWVSPGIAAAPGVVISREQMSGSDTIVASTLSTLVNIPPASTGRNYVYCRLQRTSGVQTVILSDYRLSVGRLA